MFLSFPVKKIKHYVVMWSCLVNLHFESVFVCVCMFGVFFPQQKITEVEISFLPLLVMSVPSHHFIYCCHERSDSNLQSVV